jgi:hypothetical protein
MRSLMIKATQSPNRRCRNFDDRRAPDARRRVWRLGVALLLAGLWSAPLASANEFNDGERAYARADYTRAAAIFSREAERGQAAAQTYLGYMYAQGRGVPQDEAKAAQWLRRAADQGYPAAQFLLGKMVDKGQGVKQDFVEAEQTHARGTRRSPEARTGMAADPGALAARRAASRIGVIGFGE